MFAGLVVSFAAACVRVSSAACLESQQEALLDASTSFAAAGLSTAQLEALVRLPWPQKQVSVVSMPTRHMCQAHSTLQAAA